MSFSKFPVLFAVVLIQLLSAKPCSCLGWRHDLGEEDYRKLGSNESEFRSGDDYPDFSPIVSIGYTETDGELIILGSGTLIDHGVVLTAAHVILEPKREREVIPGLTVLIGRDIASAIEIPVKAVETRLAPDRPLRRKGKRLSPIDYSDKADMNDLALLTLVRPVTAVAPAKLLKNPGALKVGQEIYFAGFGDSAPGHEKRERRWKDPEHRLAASNTVDRIIVSRASGGGGLFAIDFDDGSAQRNTLKGRPPGAWGDLLRRGESDSNPTNLEGSPYPGDSGGGAFAKLGGNWCLVGVVASGSGYPIDKRRARIQYGDVVLFTYLGAHLGWLDITTD